MFRKPYKVKTNTQMKGSEKKKVKTIIGQNFPALSSDDISLLIPNAAIMTQAKVITHSGQIGLIYYSGQNPCFYQIDNNFFPTMYTMWKFPNLLPVLSTWPPVFEKLAGGADLMLPGVVKTWGDKLDKQLECLHKGDLCAIKLTGNSTPVAVGISVISGKDLISGEWKGKAVLISSIYKDCLWQSGDKSPLPLHIEKSQDCVEDSSVSVQSHLVTDLENAIDDMTVCKEHLAENSMPTPTDTCNIASKVSDQLEEAYNTGCENTQEEGPVETASKYNMDNLLHDCFFTAVKVKGKKIELPILTSTFYKSYVLACCPPEQKLDVKKTSFKKLSAFLEEMEASGIIKVKELLKGVESIVSIDVEHTAVRLFVPDSIMINQIKSSAENNLNKTTESKNNVANYELPTIKELHCVTASVLEIFKEAGVSKGAYLSSADIRCILKDYVKRNNLQNIQNQKEVLLDAVLTRCLLNKQEDTPSLSWEDLHSRCLSKMQPAYELTFPGEAPVLKKGLLEPINITVAQRIGNKKVTIIYNLENYGINPAQFAHQVQLEVAASTSVGPTPNGKGTQVLIQGNQVRCVGKTLLEQYKIPRKYLKGLENVPNKKSIK